MIRAETAPQACEVLAELAVVHVSIAMFTAALLP